MLNSIIYCSKSIYIYNLGNEYDIEINVQAQGLNYIFN